MCRLADKCHPIARCAQSVKTPHPYRGAVSKGFCQAAAGASHKPKGWGVSHKALQRGSLTSHRGVSHKPQVFPVTIYFEVLSFLPVHLLYDLNIIGSPSFSLSS